MIPLALDPKFVKLAVAGNGALALRRLRALRQAGAEVAVFADAPEPALADAAEGSLFRHMPEAAEIAGLHALWVVDVAADVGAGLAALARRQNVLVNFEDRPEFCDFHSVADAGRWAQGYWRRWRGAWAGGERAAPAGKLLRAGMG